MGRALVMFTVPEEAIGYSLLHVDKDGKAVPVEVKDGMWVKDQKKRPQLLADHPDAFFVWRVPYSAIWQPPEEPWKQHGTNWWRKLVLLRGHRKAVRTSLETFLNARLRRLDRMVRTGYWILSAVRVRVSSLREVPVER